MAEIIDTSSKSNKTAYIGQVQWPTGIDDNYVEPFASGVANSLRDKGYEVDYYHVNGVEPEKQTNYSVEFDDGPRYPEKTQEDWNEAVGSINGAKTLYFQPDEDIRVGN